MKTISLVVIVLILIAIKLAIEMWLGRRAKKTRQQSHHLSLKFDDREVTSLVHEIDVLQSQFAERCGGDTDLAAKEWKNVLSQTKLGEKK